MKSTFLFGFIFLIHSIIISQNPIKWTVDYTTQLITFIAEIEKDWHLYAVKVPYPNEGPLPTLFEFKESDNFKKKGKTSQEKPNIKYDKSFGIDVAYYEERTKFYQKIKPLSDSFKIQGVIKYMTCNENKCLALDFEFDIAVNRQD